MKICSYSVSKHALNRTIERMILSQNIKLNKKQISKNKQKACEIILNELSDYFAISYGRKNTRYIYSGLKKDYKCSKYVINYKNKIILTVVNDVDLLNEIKCHNLRFIDGKFDVDIFNDWIVKLDKGFDYGLIIENIKNNKNSINDLVRDLKC